METINFVQILAFTLPSVITATVAYLLFNSHFRDQQNTRKWLVQRDNQKSILPLRLQAYERMTLFLERINPSHLIVRTAPLSDDKFVYQNLVISQIEQEFEHNLAQQIYVSEKCWSVILTAKNATSQMIRIAANNENINSADELREFIISDLLDKISPTVIALSFIKKEISELW